MSESHQPADDHAEQPQKAARHQKEVHHCQTRTCKQPSSPTQVNKHQKKKRCLLSGLVSCAFKMLKSCLQLGVELDGAAT